MSIVCGSRLISLDTPHVMGILNVTPDSFFDGGRYYAGDNKHCEAALAHARAMVDAGATFVDVGGESTRPGAVPVSTQEEMDRVLPVVEAIARDIDVVISVDTSSPSLISEAAKLGAGFINDVRALQTPGALEAAQATGLPVCLMHMQGQPQTMQNQPKYASVVEEVKAFFVERMAACAAAGIPSERVVLDPGFGFGKTDAHNLLLLKQMSALTVEGRPLLVGLSRKSILGRLLGRDENERLPGSLALALYALQYGARILRVHDVAATLDIVNIFKKIEQE